VSYRLRENRVNNTGGGILGLNNEEKASQEGLNVCNSCDVLIGVLSEMCGPNVSQVIMKRAAAELHGHEGTLVGTDVRVQ